MPDDGAFYWAGRRFSATDSPDVRLAFRVAEQLGADDRSRRVEVEVQNGVVLLSGTVDTREARDALAAAVRSVEGVTDLCNGLRVTRGEPALPPDRFDGIVAGMREPTPPRRWPSGWILALWALLMVVAWAGLSVLLVRLG
ncbi:MAG: BON domain-containing protein [Actinoplanes sp.]